jgi:hypothetical protein
MMPDGNLLGMIRDATDRNQAEGALLVTRLRVAATAASAPS